MTQPGHVLIIDDDPDFVAVYREMLGESGLRVTAVHDAKEASVALDREGPSFDAILLDQKLHGRGGPDSGLDLIAQTRDGAPFAKIIVVSGYATADAIERAFQAGVYDYLVKNGAFDALLRAKLRNAVEISRERRLAALSRENLVSELQAVWTAAQTETDRNRKGLLLEELVKLLFRATPGFERVETRLDNGVEEIDIVTEYGGNEAPWKHDGASYLLGECKNWSSTCGSAEFRNFHAKLTTKFGRARTGFFFAAGGFTAKFHAARAKHESGDILVIPVDRQDLEAWIHADDRMAVLNELHRRAVFGTPKG